MITSFAKVIPNPVMQDIGVDAHLELLAELEDIGQSPVIIDSKRLLQNPSAMLQKVCDALDIPFYKEMLQWSPGARAEDGSWAKYWYGNVHKSSGFAPYTEKDVDVPDHLRPLLDEAMPLYEKLMQRALDVGLPMTQ